MSRRQPNVLTNSQTGEHFPITVHLPDQIIEPTDFIFIHAIEANDKTTVTAYHGDKSVHAVGVFTSSHEAQATAIAWKTKYRIPTPA